MGKLEIPQNINAQALIKKATKLGHCFLDKATQAEIFAAEKDISKAQGDVRKADNEVTAAEDKQQKAENQSSEAQSKQQESESKSQAAPTKESVDAQGTQAESIMATSKTRSQSMTGTQSAVEQQNSVFSNLFDTGMGNIEGFSVEITTLTQENQALIAENQAIIDQLNQENTFDGTGSGTSSAYSLSTGSEIAEQKATAQDSQGSDNSKQAKIDSNNAKIEANGAKAQELTQQAQAEQQSIESAQATAETQLQQQQSEAESAKAENDKSNTKLATIGHYAEMASNIGGTLDAVGDTVKVAGVAVSTAGGILTATGTAVGVTGGTLTATGAVITTIGAPLCALFGIGVPIVGAGGATTGSGIGVAATGTTVGGTGATLVSTGATVKKVGDGLSVAGNTLKAAGDGTTAYVKAAQGDVAGAIQATMGAISSISSSVASIGGSSEKVANIVNRVVNGAAAVTTGVSAYKAAENGDTASAITNTISAVAYGVAGTFGGKSAEIAQRVSNGTLALGSGIATYKAIEEGDTTSAVLNGLSTLGFAYSTAGNNYTSAVSNLSNSLSETSQAIKDYDEGDKLNGGLNIVRATLHGLNGIASAGTEYTQNSFNKAQAISAQVAQWSGMSAEEQRDYVENDPMWNKAIQSDVDPLHNDELLPKNWSKMTDEQKRAFNQQRSIASESWKARTVYANVDPMLRPIPKEFEFPEDFNSLPKDEQKAFRQKRNQFMAQRAQEHANWLIEHQGVEADTRTGLTSDAHHRYVQDYSSEDLGRTGTQVNSSKSGATVSFDGQEVKTASGERAEISYRQYVDAHVDGEFFRSAGLDQDITDLEVRMYAHGASRQAALTGVDVNSRNALARTPRAVEMGLSQDSQLVDEAHVLATNAYSGRALPAESGYEIIDEVSDSSTGLHAKAYKKDGKVFITYSGSADKADFRVDHQMIDGNLPDQYQGALDFKDRIRQQFPDSDVIVTGHSLGGSLSQLVASSDPEVLAVTFDAVGTKNIVQRNGLTDNGNSCNIIVNGDAISNAYEHVGYTTRTNGNGVAGEVTRPDGEVVTVRTNSAHALDATSNASEAIRTRGAELDAAIEGQARRAADTSSRNYEVRHTVVEVTTAEDTNEWWRAQGYTEPPYLPGTEVQVIELTEPTTFVRVMDGDNSGVFGGWVMRAEDLLRPDGTPMTPLEIQQKFALKTTPTHVVDVTLPAGTRLRMGDVNPLEAWGKQGGGTQFDLMGQRVGEFDNARRIEDLRVKKR